MLIGTIPRIHQKQEVISETKSGKLTVYTVKPSFSTKTPSLDLPGEVKPFLVTSIYSRVSGILRFRYVDIGSKVHSGQLLAYVEVLEQDRELAQTKALLLQAQEKAEHFLSRILSSMKTYLTPHIQVFRQLWQMLKIIRKMLTGYWLYSSINVSQHHFLE